MFVSIVFPLAVEGSFTYHIEGFGDADIGKRVLAPFGKGNRKKIGIAVCKSEKRDDFKEAVVLDEMPVFGKTEIELLEFLHSYYGSGLGMAIKAMLPKKLFEVIQPLQMQQVEFSYDKAVKNLTPTVEQSYIIDAIKPNVASKFSGNLIMGVTGSGKTEIYLQLIEHALKAGYGAIVLVPEITLTPQLEDRFVKRFGDIVSVFHSRLTPLQKFKRWLDVKVGRTPIVLGARSAIFMPAKAGIIVVDEEQDSSYKQSDMMPHYNGRDIAILRAKLENIPVVLGSATPSVSTYYKAKIGKFRLFEMKERIKKTPLPKIYLSDLNGCRRGIITDKLLNALKEQSQSLILVNRRGFAKSAVCLDCGMPFSCPNCSTTLAYHKKEDRLECHWCGYSQKVDQECRCGSRRLKFVGTGTEKVEAYLKEVFPDKTVERFDSDNTKRKGSYRRILDELASGKIDIVVGTQMIAKGHDYPGIMLSAILCYESLLAGADYLSSENAIQLALQVSGRSGRKSQGKSIIQTYNIHNPDFIDIIRHDYAAFCEKELKIREKWHYPPFSHLIRVISVNPKKIAARKEIERIALKLKDEQIDFLGPSVCLISKIRNRFRFHLIIKTGRVKRAVRFLKNLVENKNFDSRIVIDVDAIDFF